MTDPVQHRDDVPDGLGIKPLGWPYGLCDCGEDLRLRHPLGTALYCPSCGWYQAHPDELCRICGEDAHPGEDCR